MLVSLAAIPVMWLLSWRKLRVAEALGSRALRTDAVESITCGWLSFVVLIGLLAQMALGAWWVDAVTSLVIVWLLVKEGREAWQGEEPDDSGCRGAFCIGAPGPRLRTGFHSGGGHEQHAAGSRRRAARIG